MRRLLYLGLRPPELPGYEVIHYPVIRIEPLPCPELVEAWPRATHLVVTSPTGAELFAARGLPMADRLLIALGEGTRLACEEQQLRVDVTAEVPTSEGVVALLETLEWSPQALCIITRSSRSRDAIRPALERLGIATLAPLLYVTHLQEPRPAYNLARIDAIAFTSPSTIAGFLAIYGAVPKGIELLIQGPITQQALSEIGVEPKMGQV